MEQVVSGQELEAEFVALTADLLQDAQVQSMAQWLHHNETTCLEHSLSVAMTAFKIGKKLHLDTRAIARGGLLHDFYLYHKRDKSAHEGLQCFDHPKIALENGKKITEFSEKEENIILAHMWPFGSVFPKSPEAMLVNLVDTFAAVGEFTGLTASREVSSKVWELMEEQ